MSLVTRSAMLQARVYPELKHAGEDILRRMGLTMTEAMELFLRRVIVYQKLPFEVIALDDATLRSLTETWESQKSPVARQQAGKRPRSSRLRRLKRE
jgi:addiction module RelB/DinJ family antitoxin